MLMWRSEGRHSTTGDEPHYLVIADGLLPTLELEQTGPYGREFRNRTISPSGLAPVDAVPGPENTHAELGPRGLFNVHNIGLPVILSVPYLLGGEMAARLIMITIGAIVIWFIARVLSLTSLPPRMQFLAAFPLTIALPFISGSTQIYPDLPAGAICVAAIYGLLRPTRESRWDLVPTLSAVAFLPWLHIRYGLPMLILLGAFTLRSTRDSSADANFRATLLRTWTIPVASVLLLAGYNTYAFGQPTGPYSGGDVMMNRIALMQFVGLFLDQNQGMIIQQPLHLVGLYFSWRMFRVVPIPTLTVTAVVFSVTIPNATHWNLYGGWSFSGRFGWTAAAALSVLTALGLARLWESHRRSFLVVVAMGTLVQVRHLIAIFAQERILYPHVFNGWIGTYSTFWRPLETVLPHWRDSRWAFSYTPNMMMLMCVITIVALGAVTTIPSAARRLGVVMVTTLSAIILGLFGKFGDLPYPMQRWAASTLPSRTGVVDGLSRKAYEGMEPGLITYGPYWEVPPGTYEVAVRYVSSGTAASNTALDVYMPDRGDLLLQSPLPNSNGIAEELTYSIRVTESNWGKMEIRTAYNGEGAITIDWVQIRRLGDNVAE